jgi:tRNA 5-methylaminomethyl-2-thiouridine biosynthesis bifunctional protein
VDIAGSFAAQRCAAIDRLPLAGALADPLAQAGDTQRTAGAQLADLPRSAGLYCLGALGSRGLTHAALLAEQLASQIGGEPQVLEKDLADAVDPARFLLRRRRGRYGASTTAAGDPSAGERSTVR